MGRKGKTGKSRQDKYYHLAKEQGYRARSAFKLIQLAQKCNIFGKCRSLIDLCAAPGGWLQVAQKQLPVAATIVGVDLVPIPAIKGVTTIQADITTEKCWKLLRREVPQGTCDVVLHDGAPNVGADWSKDAFVQNELVLHAVKLACDFLRPGGIFVSKVFRSRDWVSLLWVFESLFSRVTPTKPSSSRDVSAEIFVICEGYKAPSKLDPRFFDPRHVFVKTEAEEVESQLQNAAAVDGKKNKLSLKTRMQMAAKKNRSGYDSDSDLFRPGDVVDFFHAEGSGVDYLMKHHTLKFRPDDDYAKKVREHEATTESIVEYCQDIKVLGLAERTALLKWRQRILKNFLRSEKTAEQKLQAKQDTDGITASATTEPPLSQEALSQEEQEAMWQREIIELSEKEKLQLLKAERKKRDALKKHEIRRRLAAAAFGGGVQEDPDLFRLSEQAVKALEEEDELLAGLNGVQIIDSVPNNGFSSSAEEDDENASTVSSSSSRRDESDDELKRARALLQVGPNAVAKADRVAELEEEAQRLFEESQQRKKSSALRALAKKEKQTRRQKVYAEWAVEMAEHAAGLEAGNLEKLRAGADDNSPEMDGSDSDDADVQPGDLRSLPLSKPSKEKKIADDIPRSADEVDDASDESNEIGTISDGGEAFSAEGAGSDGEELRDDADSKNGAGFTDSASDSPESNGTRSDCSRVDEGVQHEAARCVKKRIAPTKKGSLAGTKKKAATGVSKLPPPPSSELVERFFQQAAFRKVGISLESLSRADADFAGTLTQEYNSGSDGECCTIKKPGLRLSVKSAPPPQVTDVIDYCSDSEDEGEDDGKDVSPSKSDRRVVDGVEELSDSELPAFPLTEKEKRRLKRQKTNERRQKQEDKKRRRQTNDLHALGTAVVEPSAQDKEGFEIVPLDYADGAQASVSRFEKPATTAELAEIHAVGALLTQRNTRMDLVDGAYHRYAFDDDPDAIPEWLAEEEALAMMPELPVTKEVMKQYREKWREIEARPIRKVLEAKARKQKKLRESLSKLRAKAESIAESPEFDERTKAMTIRKMMSRVTRLQKPQHAVKVTNKKGGRLVGKAKNGGRTVVVDKRLKKDKRALKIAQQKKKQGKGSRRR